MRHGFEQGSKLDSSNRYYNPNPSMDDAMHACILCVPSATEFLHAKTITDRLNSCISTIRGKAKIPLSSPCFTFPPVVFSFFLSSSFHHLV
jgi:hypothetical protein